MTKSSYKLQLDLVSRFKPRPRTRAYRELSASECVIVVLLQQKSTQFYLMEGNIKYIYSMVY